MSLCTAVTGFSEANIAFASDASLAVHRAFSAPRIDGILDDTVWRDAARIEWLTQVTPNTGAPGSYDTQVWVAFDADAVYVAVRAAQARDDIRAVTLQRDDEFDADDVVTVALDPFDRRLQGYAFSVNPLGARSDALLSRDQAPQTEWDAVWDAASFIGDGFWSTEIRIPVKSLSFDVRQTTWAFNIERVLRRQNEVQRFSGASRAFEVTSLNAVGRIDGLTGLRSGANVDITPSVVARRERNLEGHSESRVEPSVDATWRVRPALHATLTANTDFAETELDKPQSNYTRFPLFVPEQRDFFLADAAYFAFADIETSPLPFFSRRVGLDADGHPVDIDYGAKLTGREGPWVIAALHAHTGDTEVVPEKNLSVARIARQFGESTIGVIGTHGDPRSVGDANLTGVDFNYLNSDFKPGVQLASHVWAMRSDSDAAGEADMAGGVTFKLPNDPLYAHVSAEHYGAQFDPALGFVERTGIRKYDAYLSRRIHTPLEQTWPSLRDLYVDVEGVWVTDTDHRFDSYEFEMPLTLEAASGAKLVAELGVNRQRIHEEFAVADDVGVLPGDYRERRYYLETATSPAYSVNAVLTYNGGGYYGGSLDYITAEIFWRPSPQWRMSLDYEFGALRLPGGHADTHLAGMRVDWFLNTRLAWNNTIQYESNEDRLGIHSRLRWTLTGDNDVYLVYRRGYVTERIEREESDDSLDTLISSQRVRRFDQSIAAKVQWRFAL